MRASCSSIVTDDFDDFNEKNLYPSSSSSNNCISLINDIQNNDFPFFDDLNDEICKRSDSHYEQDLSQNSSQKTLHYDPQLANLIENELGLNDCQTSRKNAWGNLSYAELIAKAIQNSDQQRLTLSQIYSWMILYIPYFRDKADKKSSTGWKNSIRHNLSLHNCFVRIPNEIAGKSSWWTIDHRAKQVRGRKRLQSNENSTKSSKTTTNYLNKSNSTCSNLTNNQQSTTFTSVRDINKSFYHHLSTQTMPNILHDMLKSSSPLQTSNYSNSVDNIYSLNPTKCELIDNEYYSLNNVNEYEMISSKLSKQLKTIDHSNPLFRRMVLTIMRHQMNKSKLNNNNNNNNNNEREKILSTPPPSIIENSQCNFNSSSSSSTTTTTTTTTFDFDFETIYDLDKTTFEDSQFNIHDLSHF
ncbi:unnamed protein product [Adineta steineri]|uniref:Forkhead box protein O n=1 Tax=Adineta steineri TaxID=433720 RepID=A0A815I5E8_9BILA|nr:unnamed protein product [Adineta steineri]CAF1360937.1 unnamed protein product [Adineta steineri]